MNKIEFTKLNLRDLGMLAGLVAHKRIAPVAAEYGVSASAVSYALDRLRSALDNELLVRTRNGFRTTREAEQYAQQAKAFLEQMQKVGQSIEFDPTKETRSFVLVATEYELSGFLGDVVSRITSHYSGISVHLIQTTPGIDPDRLHGDIDVALLPHKFSRAGIIQQKILTDPYVVYFDPNYAAPKHLNAFCLARHAVMSPTGRALTNVDRTLAKLGRTRHVAVVAPNFQNLASIMLESDLIATLPSRFSNSTFRDFSTCQPPVDLEPMPVYLTYARSKVTDPGLKWLLDLIRKAAKET